MKESDIIIKQAEIEFQDEIRQQLIEEHKRKLRKRAGRTFWQRIFPWKITITRREP